MAEAPNFHQLIQYLSLFAGISSAGMSRSLLISARADGSFGTPIVSGDLSSLLRLAGGDALTKRGDQGWHLAVTPHATKLGLGVKNR